MTEDRARRREVFHLLHVLRAEELQRARGALLALDGHVGHLGTAAGVVGGDDLNRIAVAVLDVLTRRDDVRRRGTVEQEQIIVVARGAERVVPLQHAQQRPTGREEDAVGVVDGAAGVEVVELRVGRRLEDALVVQLPGVARGGVERDPALHGGADRLRHRAVLEVRLVEELQIVDDDLGAGVGEAVHRLVEGE